MQQVSQPSTSGGKQLRERKKPRYDVDLECSSDDEPVLTRRANRRKSSGPPSMKRTKRSGKLASFVNMPLDALHEIFGHLHPYDLLRLTRTTKEFRRILLHKSSISTWRTSFEDVPSLPDCPPELSEPAWANLAFSPHCHYCLAPGIRNVEWKFRVRVCSKCTPSQLVEASEFGGTLSNLYSTIPGGMGGLNLAVAGLSEFCLLVPNRGGKRYKRVFLVDQLVAFRDKLQSLHKIEEKTTYLTGRRKWIEDLNIHSANCEAWARNQADDRYDELTKLRKERREAIVKRLEELGYKKDVQYLKSGELDRESFVNKPQRLTDRIWKNVKPLAVKFIDQVRQKRLKDEYDNLVLSRKRCASEFLRNYKNSRLPCATIYPEPPDFCDFEPVRRILTQPADVRVDVASFDCLFDSIPDLFKRWREENVHSGIRNVLLSSMTAAFEPGDFNLPDWTNNVAALRHKMSLATTVFVCGGCKGHGPQRSLDALDIFGMPFYDSEDDDYWDLDGIPGQFVKPLFYPEVMAHPCLTRFSLRNEYLYMHLTAFSARRDPSTYLQECLKQRQKWKSDHLRLDKQAAKVAEKIITLAGLDPAIATTADMDRLDARFRCDECISFHRVTPPPRSLGSDDELNEDEDDENDEDYEAFGGPMRFSVLSWRCAIKHQIDRHIQGIDPSDMLAPAALRQPKLNMKNMKLLLPHGFLVTAAREEEERLAEAKAAIWCCAHCRDLPQEHDAPITMRVLRNHLISVHKLIEPVLDTDYYKHFAAKDLMNVLECVAVLQ